MSSIGLYLPYSSYAFVLPRITIFTVGFSVDITPCTTHTFSRKMCSRASVHSCNLVRNFRSIAYTVFCACDVRARTYMILCTCASASILAPTSVCLCVRSWASTSIRAHAPTSIRARGGCSPCIYVVLYNILVTQSYSLSHGFKHYKQTISDIVSIVKQ